MEPVIEGSATSSSKRGGYAIISAIAAGSSGRVNKAKCLSTGKIVAIKEVNLTDVNEKLRKCAFNEARMLSKLSHPNIVHYERSFVEDNVLCTVMDLASGGDLEGLVCWYKVKGILIPEEIVLVIFFQICDALEYCHRNCVLHRDVKTQNVFVYESSLIKLGDFGFTKELENGDAKTATWLGTPLYLAPELCLGKSYSSKADVWAAGCILFRLLTLEHAFSGATIDRLLRSIVQDEPRPIPLNYSDGIRSLVALMLTKDEDARPRMRDVLALPFLVSARAALSLRFSALEKIFGEHDRATIGESDPDVNALERMTTRSTGDGPTGPVVLPADEASPAQAQAAPTESESSTSSADQAAAATSSSASEESIDPAATAPISIERDGAPARRRALDPEAERPSIARSLDTTSPATQGSGTARLRSPRESNTGTPPIPAQRHRRSLSPVPARTSVGLTPSTWSSTSRAGDIRSASPKRAALDGRSSRANKGKGSEKRKRKHLSKDKGKKHKRRLSDYDLDA